MGPNRLLDRCACALFGGFFGAAYGALLALIMALVTSGAWNVHYVTNTALAFAACGFVAGAFVGDVIAAVFNVVFGLFAGVMSVETVSDAVSRPAASSNMRAFFWFGVATAVALLLVAHAS